jgi:superfamily II DNA or RNA helicase
MACGTGKTLTALWITERLDANTTLVLVPSLNLLSQTLTEWAHNTQRDWTYICVCSDDTVNKEDDQPINTTVDLPYPVTTKPSEIARFLKSRGRKIVFSTYQSSAQVAKAQKLSGKKFDLAICDEAHRLTGKTEADYATVLDEKKIISKKRLFMTATPRTYTANVKAKAEERGVEITSMDDPQTYGPEFHRLTFGEAIKQELLTDYQVVIVGVTDPQVQELIDRRELVSVNDTVTTDARTLAAHIGLAKATKDFDLARTISFHSRIKTAAQFANDHPKVIEWLPATHKPEGIAWTDTISGDMNTGKRRTLLQQLRKDQAGRHALLTNARCLTEGVDVPTLDGVAFIDPRNSHIDIIQAVGRAIRRSSAKKLGIVVLPVLLSAKADQNEQMDSSSFKHIWEILNALKSHDSELCDELDRLRTELGRTSRASGEPTKIQVDLPLDIELIYPDLRAHLILTIVERTTSTWQWWFGLARAFVDEFGNLAIFRGRMYKGHDLGAWLVAQRSRFMRGQLPADQVARLESLKGWSWDPRGDTWDSYYRALESFVREHGHALVLVDYPENGLQLGTWIAKQRTVYTRGQLSADRVERLESLKGWSWDPHEDTWNSHYRALKSFVRENGNALVPDNYRKNGIKLRTWISAQRARYRRGRLPKDKIERLETLEGWSWDKRHDQWNSSYRALESFVREHGDALVPQRFLQNGIQLGTWINTQRTVHKRGRLSTDRVERLESLKGWSWDPSEDTWNSHYRALKSFVRENGNAIVPDDYRKNGIGLGAWIGAQRARHRRGRLPKDKIERLETLEGWSWDPVELKWNSFYRALESFVREHGHALVPDNYRKNGIGLGAWISAQRARHRRGRLSTDRVKRLESLKGWSWLPLEDQWNISYSELKSFVREHGHALVPQRFLQNGIPLGDWIGAQRARYRRGRLSTDRVKRLESLKGWSWLPFEDQWNISYRELESFVREHGHALVPASYRQNGLRLGRWVVTQRTAYKRGRLPTDRIKRLEKIRGWSWHIRRIIRTKSVPKGRPNQ